MKKKLFGCLLLSLSLILVVPAAGQLSGKVKQGIYTSKEKDFQLTVPPMLSARFSDFKNADGLRMVLMTSDDCEAYSFTEYGPTDLTEADWFLQKGIGQKLDSMHAMGLREVPFSSKYGEGYCIYYLLPKGSPCSLMEIKSGEKSPSLSNIDAHCLVVFLRIGKDMYQFQYFRGVEGDIFNSNWNDEKAVEKLRLFVDGFVAKKG